MDSVLVDQAGEPPVPDGMRALRFRGAGDVSLETSPVPSPSRGEVLLRVACCGVCGSDASEYAHGPLIAYVDAEPHPVTGHSGPVVLGHEFSGYVVAAAPGARVPVGTLVASSGGVACGDCSECRGGRPNLCLNYYIVGMHRDGGLAEYVTVPESACADAGRHGLGPATAALAQPMAIAVHAAARGRLSRGARVAVIGAGGIGIFLTYALVEAGAVVTVIDVDADRLPLALELGAGRALLAEEARVESAQVYDTVFETSGARSGLGLAAALAGRGGTIVVSGLHPPDVVLSPRELVFSEQTWIGSMSMNIPVDLPEALRVLATRETGWADVAPTVHPLETIAADGLTATSPRAAVKTLFSPHLSAAASIKSVDHAALGRR